MSGWTERENGCVRIIHHSTSSLIEVLITTHEEVEQGVIKKTTKQLWLDYASFCDLRIVVNQTDFP
jgi:hypothetical protein